MNLTEQEQKLFLQKIGAPAGSRLQMDADGNYSVVRFSAQTADPVQQQRLAESNALASRQQSEMQAVLDPVTRTRALAQAGALGVAEGIGPSAAGGLSAAGLQRLASAIAPRFVATPVGAVTTGVGAIGTALAGSIAAKHLQDQAMQSMLSPEQLLAREQLLTSPEGQRAYAVGNVLSGVAGGMRPGIDPIKGTARLARNVAEIGPAQALRVGAQTGDVGAAINTGLGTAMSTGMAGYELAQGGDPVAAAIGVLGGAVMNQPNALGKALGFGKPYNYVPDPNASFRRGGFAAQAPVNEPAVEQPPLNESLRELPPSKLPSALLEKRRAAVAADEVKMAKQQFAHAKDVTEQEKAILDREWQNVVSTYQSRLSELAALDFPSAEAIANGAYPSVSAKLAAVDRQLAAIKPRPYDEKVASSVAESIKQRKQVPVPRLPDEPTTLPKPPTQIQAPEEAASQMRELSATPEQLAANQKAEQERILREAAEALKNSQLRYSTSPQARASAEVPESLHPNTTSIAQGLANIGHDVQLTKGRFVTPDDPQPREGSFDPATGRVEASTENVDTLPHETIHAMFSRLTPSEKTKMLRAVAKDPQYLETLKKEPGLSTEEFLAREGSVDLLRRIQNEDFGLIDSLMSSIRRGLGTDTVSDNLRKLGNMFTSAAPASGDVNFMRRLSGRPTGGELWEAATGKPTAERFADMPRGDKRYSTGEFTLESVKQAQRNFGMRPSRSGELDGGAILNVLNKLPAGEQEIIAPVLRSLQPGKMVNVNAVLQQLQKLDPGVNVHAYGMDREQSAAKKELDALTHDWLETRDGGTQEAVRRAVRSQERNNARGVEAELATLRTAEDVEKARRYLQLTTQVEYDPDVGGPTATHYYNQVSPSSIERPMPAWTKTKRKRNLQRVDVAIPPKLKEGWVKRGVGDYVNSTTGQERSGHGAETSPDLQGVKWKQDDLHENLPNTLGWAAIQYEDGPNGERIAHIFEAQSRWGQEKRAYEKAYEAAINKQMDKYPHITEADPRIATIKRNAHNEALQQVQQYRPGMDHPLDAEYNRLILKAAIDKAREEGATHIAISDADTAMMTEMHDQSASVRTTLSNYDSIASKMQDAWDKQTGLTEFKIIPNPAEYRGTEDFFVARNGVELGTLTRASGDTYALKFVRSALEQALHERHPRGYSDIIDSPEPFQLQRDSVVSQEPGMRANYSTKPVAFSREGELVAHSQPSDYIKALGEKVPRNNPDYPASIMEQGQLHKIAQELTGDEGQDFTFGDHKNAFRAAEEGEAGYSYTGPSTIGPRPNLIFKNPDGTPKTSSTGKLYSIADISARRATGEPYSLFGKRYSIGDESASPISTVGRIANRPLRRAILRAFDEKSRIFGKIGHLREMRAILADAPEDLQDKLQTLYNTNVDTFSPAERKVADRLMNLVSQTANEINAYGPPRRITPRKGYWPNSPSPEMLYEIRNSRTSPATIAIEDALAAHFGDKNLAKEYVDFVHSSQNDDVGATEFGPLRKAAGKGLPKETIVNGEALPIRDPDMYRSWERYANRAAKDLVWHKEVTTAFGKDIRLPEYAADISSDKNLVQAIDDYEGRRPAHPIVHEGMRLSSAAAMGAITAVRNVVQLPGMGVVFGGKRLGPLEMLVRSAYKLATQLPTQARAAQDTGHLRVGQSNMAFGKLSHTEIVPQVLGKAANAIDWLGRAEGEAVSRVISRTMGEVAADIALRQNNTDILNALEISPTEPEARERLAAAIASRIEGTYDSRGLPTKALTGTVGDILAIHKWAIENTNTWWQHILKPAARGNPWPLLYALGAAFGITIPAIESINEKVRGRKSDPTLDEIEAAEKITGDTKEASRAAWFTGLMELASIGGFAGHLANAAAQTAAGNRKGADIIFVPANQLFGNQLPKLLGDYTAALHAGEDPEKATKALGLEVTKAMMQAVRSTAGTEQQRKQASLNRDRAVYENLVFGESPNPVDSNKLRGIDEREFKQTEDLGKAAELAGKLLERYSKLPPLVARRKIQALGQLSAREMKNDVPELSQYMDYLTNAGLSKEEVDQRLADFVAHVQRNRLKASMVPDIPTVPLVK